MFFKCIKKRTVDNKKALGMSAGFLKVMNFRYCSSAANTVFLQYCVKLFRSSALSQLFSCYSTALNELLLLKNTPVIV